MRISRPVMFMEMADVAAKRSTCFRLNVGAILTQDDNIVSIGYNGTPPGEPHCSGNTCPGRNGCTLTWHAEANAINRCRVALTSGFNCLYVTDSPCPDCSELMLANNVRRLFFRKLYRLNTHLTGLGIEVYQVTPAGYVVDWKTREVVDFK